MQKLKGSKICVCGKTISSNALACRDCQAKTPLQKERSGRLEILNVGAGDVKLTFDKADIADVIRARRMVTDMLRRGYAIVVEVERDGKKAYERIHSFDEARGEYILVDLDAPITPAAADPAPEPAVDTTDEASDLNMTIKDCACGRPAKHRGACRGKRRMPLESTVATAIGRSAGG